MPFYIPLSAALALQVLVVAAAFTAVIVVLTEQERTQFKDSLTKQLSLQRANSLQAVANPLLQRKETFNKYTQQYLNGYLNSKQFAAPSDQPGATSDLPQIMPFYNHFYALTQSDSMVRQVFVVNQSFNEYPGYAVGGDKYIEGYHSTDNSQNIIWNLWMIDSAKLVVIQDEFAKACFGTYPINPATCATYSQYYASDVAFGSPAEYNRTGGRRWGAPGMLADPTLPGGLAHVYTYSITVNVNVVPYVVLGISFSLDNVKPLIVAGVSSRESKAAVFAQYEHKRYATNYYYLVGGKFDFSDYDAATFAESNNDYFKSDWRGGSTPDAVLNELFFLTQNQFLNQTASTSFDFTVGGSEYVGSMARFVDSTAYMNWLLIEYTPRDVFYGASYRARVAGIVIGVCGAVLVLVSCLLIWVAIRSPLLKLKAGMALAAQMRNDEAEPISAVLLEVNELAHAYRQMNEKLLAARPFLPQSLLQAGDTTCEEEEEEQLAAVLGGGEGESSCVSDGITVIDRQNTSGRLANSTSRTTVISGQSDTFSSSQQQRSPMGAARNSPRKAKNGIAGLQRDLQTRRVGVLAINVIGFHHAMSGGQNNSIATLMQAHKTLAKMIETATAEERGIVDYFHGDHFICTFNASRLCGNSARSGAEAAIKIHERFLADELLTCCCPKGLAMGLGAGKSLVGNIGTDSMQRLATMGKAYTNAIKLLEVMGRQVLYGGGKEVNPHLATRCLLKGRTIHELDTCNISCQILGGVHIEAFMPTSETHNKQLGHIVANELNHSVMRNEDLHCSLSAHSMPVTAASSDPPSVLVACLGARSAHTKGAADEWLYQMDNDKKANLYKDVNEALYALWVDGLLPSPASDTNFSTHDTAVLAWSQFIFNTLHSAGSVAAAKQQLTFQK